MSQSYAYPYKNAERPFRILPEGEGTPLNSIRNEPSAIVQIDSKEAGFLPPRMSTSDRNGIFQPTAGLLIFNTTSNVFEFFNGTSWTAIGSGGGGGSPSYLEGEIVWEPNTEGAHALSPNITVTGAALGSFVVVAPPYDLQGVIATAYVSAANTVKISLFNPSSGAVSIGSGTWKVRVL